ncbi:B3 domain-containing protein REM20-like [Salvia divinorum]|uniref:B3 domain-containing protein REM20-like n=1 Tax=Salvia divinorum TaxID=28513 RepID=A0ABD1GRC6_SALDI
MRRGWHGDEHPHFCKLVMPTGGEWRVRLLNLASGCHFLGVHHETSMSLVSKNIAMWCYLRISTRRTITHLWRMVPMRIHVRTTSLTEVSQELMSLRRRRRCYTSKLAIFVGGDTEVNQAVRQRDGVVFELGFCKVYGEGFGDKIRGVEVVVLPKLKDATDKSPTEENQML